MLDRFINKEFFSDRLMAVLAASTVIFGILGATWVFLRVQQYDYKITVGYSQYGADTFKLGNWYSLYELAAFIVVASIVNLVLSIRFFRLNRGLALSILLLHHVILIFFFIVAQAILGTSPVTS